MKRLTFILSILAAFSTSTATAQSMLSNIRSQWETYIVVSSAMPRDQLISLAKEASLADAVMVFNGFPNRKNSIPATQRMISEINLACCDKQHPSRWVIDPKIIGRYHILASPSFILAHGESTRNDDFSLITGDIDLANALKSFVQRSGSPAIRQRATAIYQRAFATQ